LDEHVSTRLHYFGISDGFFRIINEISERDGLEMLDQAPACRPSIQTKSLIQSIGQTAASRVSSGLTYYGPTNPLLGKLLGSVTLRVGMGCHRSA
jgi:hypothetical protein